MGKTHGTFTDRFVTVIFVLSFIIAVGVSWYRYSYTKNYDYLVEAPCDPAYDSCFFRDCEGDPDNCPPNGLSYYDQFYVKAYDFPKCADDSCAYECLTGAVSCTQVVCGESEEDVCSDFGTP